MYSLGDLVAALADLYSGTLHQARSLSTFIFMVNPYKSIRDKYHSFRHFTDDTIEAEHG